MRDWCVGMGACFLPDAQRQTYTRVSKITFSPSAQKQALIPHIIKTQKKITKVLHQQENFCYHLIRCKYNKINLFHIVNFFVRWKINTHSLHLLHFLLNTESLLLCSDTNIQEFRTHSLSPQLLLPRTYHTHPGNDIYYIVPQF